MQLDTGWLGGGAALLVAAIVGWWWIARSRKAAAGRDPNSIAEDGADVTANPAVGNPDPREEVPGQSGKSHQVRGVGEPDPAEAAPTDAPANLPDTAAAAKSGSAHSGALGESAAATPRSPKSDGDASAGNDSPAPDGTETAESGEPAPSGPGEPAGPAADDPGPDADGPAADTVLVKATPLTSEDVARSLAQARADLWASRWLLGNQVCEDMETAIAQAQQALDSGYLATGQPARAALGLRPYLAEVERTGEALNPLRRASFAAAANAELGTSESADGQDLEKVSVNPAGGLAQLAQEVRDGLQQARLEVARLAPTAGSTISTQLRNWLSQANIAAVTVSREIAAPGPAPLSARHLQELEAKLLGAIWRRRLIALVAQYRRAHDWAQTTTDARTWFELAQLATEITGLQADLLLREATISEDDLATLARVRTLTATSEGAEQLAHQRTSAAVVRQCEDLWQRWRGQFTAAAESAAPQAASKEAAVQTAEETEPVQTAEETEPVQTADTDAPEEADTALP